MAAKCKQLQVCVLIGLEAFTGIPFRQFKSDCLGSDKTVAVYIFFLQMKYFGPLGIVSYH